MSPLKVIFGQEFTREGVAFDKQHGVFKVVEPHCADIIVEGEKTGKFWTKRALERLGYTVTSSKKGVDAISVIKSGTSWSWELNQNGQLFEFGSIADLVKKLKREEGLS